jgi:hypothetical protein
MKKSIIGGALFTFMMLAAPMTGSSSCSVTRQCLAEGSITCSGEDDCFMSLPGEINPFVSCDGKVQYCFGIPPVEVE